MEFDHVQHTLVCFSENDEATRLVRELCSCARNLVFHDASSPSHSAPGSSGGSSVLDGEGSGNDSLQLSVAFTVDDTTQSVSEKTQCVASAGSIASVRSATGSQSAKILSSVVGVTTELEVLTGRYMNSPHLLYPHIEGLVGEAFRILRGFIELPSEQWAAVVTSGPSDAQRLALITLEHMCYHIYNVSKVVGVRRLIACAPNEVRLLVPVTFFIEFLQTHERVGGDLKYENKRWCMEYVFLAWLSLLVYTPFALSSLWRNPDGGATTLQVRLLRLAMHYLGLSTKARDAAAIVLSTLFARPDVSDAEVSRFMAHCARTLNAGSSRAKPPLVKRASPEKETFGGASSTSAGESTLTTDRDHDQHTTTAGPVHDLFDDVDELLSPQVSQPEEAPIPPPLDGEEPDVSSAPQSLNDHGQIGVLTVLKQMLKRMSRDDLAPHLTRLSSCILDNPWLTTSSACRKLRAACIGRLAVHLLPSQSYSQRYRRRLRKLMESAPDPEEPEPEVGNFVMDPRVEVVVEQLLGTLVDVDIRVRWASAKSIGRISVKLPMYLNDQIIDHVLQIVQSQYDAARAAFTKGEAAVHGGCLAIAEIIRGGFLHPHMLARVLNCVVLTLGFDVWRGKGSAGTAVRDASCYICWAIVRNFTSSLIQPSHLIPMSKALVNMALFDISINCRRAACAALQELVGRVGNVAHGLDLIVMADYYTVSNRRNAFVNVSYEVSKLGFYTLSMIDNVMKTKLHHPDLTTRQYAAVALGRMALALVDSPNSQLVTRNGRPVYLEIVEHCLATVASTTLGMMHGSLCALTQVLAGLLQHGDLIADQFPSISQVPVLFERKRLFRLKGGIIIRQSVCSLIKYICRIAHRTPSLSLSSDELEVYTIILKDGVRNFTIDVQVSAVEAMHDLFNVMCATHAAKATALLQQILRGIRSKTDHVAARRGYALALGAITEPMCAGNYEEVIGVLCEEVLTNLDYPDIRDAQTRQHSLISLASLMDLCVKLPLSCSLVEHLVSCLEHACFDSEIDSRGDVGSWVREVAIEIIAYILHLKQSSVHLDAQYALLERVTPDHLVRLVNSLVGVCLEPLDHTRARATFLFSHIFGGAFRFNVEWIWNRVFYGARYEFEVARRGTFPVSCMDTLSAVEHVTRCLAHQDPPPQVNGSSGPFSISERGGAGSRRRPLGVRPSSDVDSDMDTDTDSDSSLSIDSDESPRQFPTQEAPADPQCVPQATTAAAASCCHERFFEECVILASHEAPVLSAIAHNINWHVVHAFDLQELLLTLTSESMDSWDTTPRAQGNVSLRLPGYSLSPLCVEHFMWLLHLPSFSFVVVRALFQVLGGMAVQQTWKQRSLEQVVTDFLRSQHNAPVRAPTGEWTQMHELLLRYVMEVYRTAIKAKNAKLCTRVVGAARLFVSHHLVDVPHELVELLAAEARAASNYPYLKGVFKCLQAAYEATPERRTARVALRSMLGFLCHQYPTLRSFAHASMEAILSNCDWGPSSDTLGAALAMLQDCVADKGGACPVVMQRLLALLKL
ncbi:beta-tubulin cofactor D [Babesia caballi]|uniref:Beta-tubulin cofactor D n=1 Tax=Babesia caballi TaxID=5871 RepID=A0AAV4LR04_BABCB|nr:beta-tubulin cofactor D [Babesia caballi]